MTIAGKNEIYKRENLVRPILVHQVLGPKPPPPLPPPAQKKPCPPPPPVLLPQVLGKPYEESEIKRACFEYGCLQCELQAPEREISGLGPDMVLLPTFVRRASDGVASHRGVPVLTTHSEGDAEGGGGLLGALCSGRQSPGSGSPTTARSGRSEPDLEDTLPGTLPVVRGSRRSRVGSVTNLAGEGQPSAQPGIFLRSDLPGSFTTLDPHPRPSAVYRVSADVGTPLLP